MTVFSTTWDAAFEGLPGDNEDINLGAAKIRALKVALHQRLVVDHAWGGNASDGIHVRVSMGISASNVASEDPATYGALFGKFVGGFAELCWTDLSGNTTQLTSGGRVNSTNGGATGARPTNPQLGFTYFDTTLFKPVFWSGIDWRDATGAVA
jgi:hypothetical protein